MVADKLVDLRYIDGVSHAAGRLALRTNWLRPWLTKRWCIPKANAEFVWRREDILGVHTRPYDLLRPLISLDEVSKQLVGEIRCPRPGQPRPARCDFAHARTGLPTSS
jgi:hypothetical protein